MRAGCPYQPEDGLRPCGRWRSGSSPSSKNAPLRGSVSGEATALASFTDLAYVPSEREYAGQVPETQAWHGGWNLREVQTTISATCGAIQV